MNTIRRSDAIDALMKTFWFLNPDSIIDVIMGVEDAEPQRMKGRWQSGDSAGAYCSECEQYTPFTYRPYTFCPNCGADMRGEVKRMSVQNQRGVTMTNREAIHKLIIFRRILERGVFPVGYRFDAEPFDIAISALEKQEQDRWIPCSERLPEMHDAGILKKIGVQKRSKHVFITIKDCGSEEAIVDADAELRDGEWYSDTLRWLKASHKNVKVTAWMPYPEPYREESKDD